MICKEIYRADSRYIIVSLNKGNFPLSIMMYFPNSLWLKNMKSGNKQYIYMNMINHSYFDFVKEIHIFKHFLFYFDIGLFVYIRFNYSTG